MPPNAPTVAAVVYGAPVVASDYTAALATSLNPVAVYREATRRGLTKEEKLSKLQDLYATGVFTAAEYEKKRKDILASFDPV